MNVARKEFKIVTASFADMEWIMKMRAIRGRNPGQNDAITYQLADPTGFYVGLLNGETIGCVSGMKYENSIFWGNQMVLKEHRGKGYGKKLFQHVYNYVKDFKTSGYDTLTCDADIYAHLGFKAFHHTTRYVGIVDKLQTHCRNIVDAKKVPFEKLLEYDARHSPDRRKYFLAACLNVGTDRAFVYLDSNRDIQGFGAIRKAVDGYKIAPLYAQSMDIAERLIYGLTATFENCKVMIDIPTPNESAMKLIEKLQLQATLNTVRMYLNRPFTYDVNSVYAVSSLEIG
ncbi:hypothetical protein TrispH2_009743 [Trichoplax sp. H2]|uniref:N-acetyltransferase domain-containing protein n=1 Tax=Trichoplax adhaerens TaxID=10228 RepID=B3SBH2_TRIAD|nr:hypothetical protein TRIADDRAFT_61616 [Trichoplax adhaerens]EDV19955.1 hypothetical protein TRIADDRAFT_61616 [Trichoplax adhaerens]RDD37801.1 hypothetical protein TrispH2_009743 [Trichoplax sp. H2]|eukprot:XP_002117545.1 hypothetical protein TRIADDRAFT_61616 [Trichoplax adhaerens]